MKSKLCLCVCLLAACSGSDPVSDAGANTDSGPVDAASADLGTLDTGSVEADAGQTDGAGGDSFNLVIEVGGSGTGRVQDLANGIDCETAAAPCSYTFPLGVTLTLDPVPGPNSNFRRWNDAVCALANQGACSFPINTTGSLGVIAIFVL